MRELAFVTCCPNDTYFTWQVHMWLESLKEMGHSADAVVLVFCPAAREDNPKWKQIVDLYPEATFHFYREDEKDMVSNLIPIYIPIIRPYVMWRFLKENPQYISKALFYCDSDILFTSNFNVDSLLEDDVHYLSDTNSYINADYFDSKIKDVLPEKLEEYKTRDVLAEVASLVGISRDVCVANNLNSGGAQYLLKNTDSKFWSKVMNDCIIIRTYLQKVNREFFPSENAGFQSWCADMFAVLWNLWLRDQETRVVPEMNFAWSTDPIDKLQSTPIFHNAGIVSEMGNGYPAFYKGKYHTGSDPMQDSHLDVVLSDQESQKYCNWFYTKKLKELKEKYQLIY